MVEPLVYAAGFVFRLMGPCFCGALYYLIWYHFEIYMTVITKVLWKRLGVKFAFVWIAIGLTITFNIVWNHCNAMLIKPGSPIDLDNTEKLRKKYNKDVARKEFDEENDKFEGCSSEVKALLRYRTKTMGDLRKFWTKTCHRCKEVKPARAHHCAVCDVCVF